MEKLNNKRMQHLEAQCIMNDLALRLDFGQNYTCEVSPSKADTNVALIRHFIETNFSEYPSPIKRAQITPRFAQAFQAQAVDEVKGAGAKRFRLQLRVGI
jgi:hypothetical protein